MSDALDPAHGRQRIEELEARVKWLEGALTSVLQERRRDQSGHRGQREFNALFSLDDEPSADLHQRTQKLEVLEARAEPAAANVDAMRFTSSFSTLDERLREQLESEAAAAPAPDLAPPVLIDPEMIDRAFARPPPELIEVRCDLEQSYPHLMERVLTLWGEPELLPFLRKLIVDERGGRQGFPFEVMSELLILAAVANAPLEPDAWE